MLNILVMGVLFLGTSTTAAAQSGDVETNSITYVIGVLLFTCIFICGFVLAWCQVKGMSNAEKLRSVSPEPDVASKDGIPEAMLLKIRSGGTQQFVVGRTNCVPSQPQPEPVLGQDCGSAIIGAAVHLSSLRATGAGLQDKPDAWTAEELQNIAEWAAARAARKKNLQGVKIARPSSAKVDGVYCGKDVKVPPARSLARPPPMPPPKLEVLQRDLDQAASCAAHEAKVKVYKQLKSTAMDDMEVRKKTFKRLCSKWHPDKNLPIDVELATEVFQYLQAQKTWYLSESHPCSSTSLPDPVTLV